MAWRKAILYPIHKKRNLTSNYRGIALLDTAYKIMVMLIRDKLMEHTDEHMEEF